MVTVEGDRVDLYGPGTATRDALERLSNRWTILVTHVLEEGPTRFNDLKARLGLSSQVLTRVLRQLERDGLIKRQLYAEVPVRVEYSLTPLGGTMCAIVQAVQQPQPGRSEHRIRVAIAG